MSEVMDIMLKIGVTEEVTSAFHGISSVMERVIGQTEKLKTSFTSISKAMTGIGTALAAPSVGIIASLAMAVKHAKEFEESMTGAGLAGLDAGRAYSLITELSYKMPLKLAEGVQMYHAMSSLLGGPKAAEAILPQVAALSHEFKRNVSPDIASIFTSLGIQGPGKEKEREQVLDLISQAHSFAGPNFHLSDVVQQFKRMKSAGMALEMSELPMIFAQIAQDAKGGGRGGVGGGVGQFAHEMHAIATEFEKAKSAVHTRKDGTVVRGIDTEKMTPASEWWKLGVRSPEDFKLAESKPY